MGGIEGRSAEEERTYMPRQMQRHSETHGEPHSVSASEAAGNERANPKSATLSWGMFFGWPIATHALSGGCRRRFCAGQRRSAMGIPTH